MIYRLRLLRREGVVIPKYQLALRTVYLANVEVSDYQDHVTHRWTRRAVALEQYTGRVIEAIPPLHDATLIVMASDYWTLGGTERILDPLDDKRVMDYAQTWFLERIDDQNNSI